MFASIRRYTVSSGSAPEISRLVNQTLVPIMSASPGFVAYYFLDAGADVVATVSVFQDQAGADASNQTAASWIRQHVTPLVKGPPQITSGLLTAYKST